MRVEQAKEDVGFSTKEEQKGISLSAAATKIAMRSHLNLIGSCIRSRQLCKHVASQLTMVSMRTRVYYDAGHYCQSESEQEDDDNNVLKLYKLAQRRLASS